MVSNFYNWLFLFHFLIHALFKSLLFLLVGLISHISKDKQDLRLLKINYISNPIIYVLLLLGILFLIGLPSLISNYSKELIILSYNLSHVFIYLLLVISIVLTIIFIKNEFQRKLIFNKINNLFIINLIIIVLFLLLIFYILIPLLVIIFYYWIKELYNNNNYSIVIYHNFIIGFLLFLVTELIIFISDQNINIQIKITCFYWHFVDIMWILIFLIVYVI